MVTSSDRSTMKVGLSSSGLKGAVMRWIIRALVIWIALAPFAVRADQAASCSAPIDLHDGWAVAAPDKESLDPALICGIGPRLKASKEANAHGVVITRHLD
jgi:hypothetical protein